MIAVDTNLLIYAHRAGVAEHAASRKAIERVAASPRGWGISLPSVSEFWSVVTHPTCVGGASTPAAAADFMISLLDSGGGEVWQPTPGFGIRLAQAAADLKLSGPRIFDLQIAMIAQENGAREIWTHDKGFVTFPGLRVVHPLS